MCQMTLCIFSENQFQIRELAAELYVFEYGDTTYSTFEKIALNVEDLCKKNSLATTNHSKFSALIGSLFQM